MRYWSCIDSLPAPAPFALRALTALRWYGPGSVGRTPGQLDNKHELFVAVETKQQPFAHHHLAITAQLVRFESLNVAPAATFEGSTDEFQTIWYQPVILCVALSTHMALCATWRFLGGASRASLCGAHRGALSSLESAGAT